MGSKTAKDIDGIVVLCEEDCRRVDKIFRDAQRSGMFDAIFRNKYAEEIIDNVASLEALRDAGIPLNSYTEEEITELICAIADDLYIKIQELVKVGVLSPYTN